jgi:uncharacterized radical SAM superfamily Fe-S cluster-containing enzyme
MTNKCELTCAICYGSGKVNETLYQSVTCATDLRVVLTGNQTKCPGCDGTGESERYRKEMVENGK